MGPDDIRSRETIKGTVELDGATLDHVDCRLRGQYSGWVCGDKRNIREHVPPIWRTLTVHYHQCGSIHIGHSIGICYQLCNTSVVSSSHTVDGRE